MRNFITKNKSILIIGFIVVISFLTYSNVLKNELMEVWDDQIHVTNNEDIRAINFQNIKTIFSKSYVYMYQPITELSYSIDYSIWELNPFGYHLTNLLLHLTNIVLVYFLCRSLGINPLQSGFITALFATTSLATEPVSWISARSTLLSASFIFGGLLTYILYLKNNRNTLYFLTILFYTLALFSRVTAVIFPVLLVVADIYLKKPWYSLKFQLNKIPLVLISIPIVWIGLSFRHLYEPSADNSTLVYHIVPRVLYYLDHWLSIHALSAVSVWPEWISFQHLSAIALIILILIIQKHFKQSRLVIVFGILFFLVALAPYLLYAEKTNPVADRYGYIPHFGLYFIVGSAIFYLINKNNRFLKITGLLLFFTLLTFNVLASQKYSKAWKNEYSLWSHSSRVEPTQAYYKTKLGLYYVRNGQFDEAEIQLSKAYNLDSLDVFTLFNIAALKHETKKYKDAVKYYSKAIEIEPSSPLFHMGRANSYLLLEEFEYAKADLDISISSYGKPQANLYYLRAICKIETNESPCTDLKIALNLGMDIALSKYAKYCQ